MKAGRASHGLLGLVLVLVGSLAIGAQAPSDFQARAVADIQAREYDLSWQDQPGAWQAPNRAHNLRTTFTDAGIQVVPRLEQETSWTWGLALVRYGREGAKLEARASLAGAGPALSARANHLDRDWGEITEWYVNDAQGLEHGFTLAEAPAGGVGSEVHLDLALSGTLEPTVNPGGQGIDFRVAGAGMSVLRYAKLSVVDARGRELPARMEGFFEAGTRGIRIVFDDRDAAYPVTVDPVATSTYWSNEGNQASAAFGFSVATAGDVDGDGYSDILIGAERYDNGQTDEGRAFLYEGAPDGGMSPGFPNWLAEGEQAGALFGGCVAPAGDVNGDGYADVLVGARTYDNGQTDEGRVYLYLGSGDGLSFDPAWTAESDQAGALFGVSVATAGDVNKDGFDDVIVGATLYDNGQTDEGRAWVYLGSASGLSATPAWITESNQASAAYGVSVASAGDVNADGFDDFLVGARLYDNGQADEGRVYLYYGNVGNPQTAPAMTYECDQAGANFGRSVAPAGDINGNGYADFIVGAYTYDGGQTDEGRVFVYYGAFNSVPVVSGYSLECDQVNAQFGITVAPAGDVNGDGYADVLVGAYLYDNNQTDEGRAFLYLGSAAGIELIPTWTAESDQASAQLGWSVATAGDVNGDGFSDILVGANLYDNGQTDEGRAFLYLGGASVPEYVAGWAYESNRWFAGFGRAVATAGDVNGDGYSDLIVGADLDESGTGDPHGAAYVFHGSSSGLSPSPSWSVTPTEPGSFGNSVARAGDVNGDGYDDVVVGNYLRKNETGHQTGRTSIFLGSASGLSATPAWFADGSLGEMFGYSVAGAGDVNGDGYADVLVGGPRVWTGANTTGRAFLYLGSSTGLAATPAWTADGTFQEGRFGWAVASAGDVNADGYGDVVIGAPEHDAATTGGRAYVYLGSASGLAATPVWVSSEANAANAHFGSAVGAADVNGDGKTDVLVGAWNKLNPASFRGRVYVYQGTASGPVATASAFLDGNGLTSNFSFSLAGAGDVNADGFGDVIVGGHTSADRGRAFLYFGSPSGPGLTPAMVLAPPEFGLNLGFSVAGAGDVNGDGFADIVAGISNYSNAQDLEGQARLYYGNHGRGLDRGLRQLRTDGSAPIALAARSSSPDFFLMRSLGRSAAGRARVRLQYNVEQVGIWFDWAGVRHGAPEDTGATGSVLHDEQVQVFTPTPGAAAHWRARYASDSPFFPWTPWFSPAGNNGSEAHLRMSFCVDGDGDGFGANGAPSCPSGPQLDCDDTRADVYPGGLEACDGLDNNCNAVIDDVLLPSGSPSLFAARAGADTQLSWSAIPGATHYDVVRGSLASLRATLGNFSTALSQCVANDVYGTSTTASGTPTVVDGYFFLVRGTVSTCARGTFDESSVGQVGVRDAELAASAAACP